MHHDRERGHERSTQQERHGEAGPYGKEGGAGEAQKPAVQLGEPRIEECARRTQALGSEAGEHARESSRDRESGGGDGQHGYADKPHPWVVDEEGLADRGELPLDKPARSPQGRFIHRVPSLPTDH